MNNQLSLINSQQLIIPQDGDTDFFDQFITSTDDDWLQEMLIEYSDIKKNIVSIFEISQQGCFGAMHYFLNSKAMGDWQGKVVASSIFNLESAIACLNSEFWKRAFDKTDIYSHLPQKRRDEWNDMFRDNKTIEFSEESVRSTISHHLHSRTKYLAERVDGIFQNLSRSHVTNQPEGFSKRFIMEYMYTMGDSPDSRRSGFISDLRGVVSMLTGREIKGHIDSYGLLRKLYQNHGEYFDIDGGAFRMKAYLKGTLHIEIHPDIAWKLNQLLAILYPVAIPSSLRRKPTKKPKEFNLRNDLLSIDALHIITGSHVRENGRAIDIRSYGHEKSVQKEVESVMLSIGGVPHKKAKDSLHDFVFDYDIREVIDQIILCGYIPDYQSYQYYPTIPAVAKAAISMADIDDTHQCLEPSAGTGGISDFLPIDRTICVEISNIHCAILKSKGFMTIQKDFLIWSFEESKRFDRIVMNPPFSKGRAELHVKAAANMLTHDGVLVAILPSTFIYKNIIDGFTHSYSKIFENCFNNTGARVVILRATKI